jgi:hypothetical protein
MFGLAVKYVIDFILKKNNVSALFQVPYLKANIFRNNDYDSSSVEKR